MWGPSRTCGMGTGRPGARWAQGAGDGAADQVMRRRMRPPTVPTPSWAASRATATARPLAAQSAGGGRGGGQRQARPAHAGGQLSRGRHGTAARGSPLSPGPLPPGAHLHQTVCHPGVALRPALPAERLIHVPTGSMDGVGWGGGEGRRGVTGPKAPQAAGASAREAARAQGLRSQGVQRGPPRLEHVHRGGGGGARQPRRHGAGKVQQRALLRAEGGAAGWRTGCRRRRQCRPARTWSAKLHPGDTCRPGPATLAPASAPRCRDGTAGSACSGRRPAAGRQ